MQNEQPPLITLSHISPSLALIALYLLTGTPMQNEQPPLITLSHISPSLALIALYILTGTPMQNELGEFFNMVSFCNPGMSLTHPFPTSPLHHTLHNLPSIPPFTIHPLKTHPVVTRPNPGVLGSRSEFRKRYERPILRSREPDALPRYTKTRPDKQISPDQTNRGLNSPPLHPSILPSIHPPPLNPFSPPSLLPSIPPSLHPPSVAIVTSD